jgi:CarD family transcriptional regulator
VTFQVGDKVIYPNHGLGIVERIETKTIMGTTCGFYQLRMVANDTTVLVPVTNVSDVGLRRAVGGDEISRLFLLLSDGKIDSQQNWKGRFKDNSDRMRTGSLYDVVEVLKSLSFLAKSKTLSFREKRMLDRARFLVVSEIAEVTHEPLPNIEQKVDTALDCCIATKGRVIVKPVGTGAVAIKTAPPIPVKAAVPTAKPAPVVAVKPAGAVAVKATPLAGKAAPARPRAMAKNVKGGTVATKRVVPRA